MEIRNPFPAFRLVMSYSVTYSDYNIIIIFVVTAVPLETFNNIYDIIIVPTMETTVFSLISTPSVYYIIHNIIASVYSVYYTIETTRQLNLGIYT